MLKCWNHSTSFRKYAVTYSQTLEEVPWHLGLIKMTKNSKSLKKIVKISIKLRVLASGCSSVASHGGLHRGLMGVQQWGVGGGGGGGVGAILWVQQWGCLHFLRTALHTIRISLQNSLSWNSWKAPRAFNARWALPFYTVFEDEKSKASDEKSVKQKIA